MTPIEIAPIVASALAVGLSVASILRKKNHVHDDLRKQLDEALAENVRLNEELTQSRVAHHAAALKLTPEVAKQYAKVAVDYAKQIGGTGEEKLRHALGCFDRLDAGDNGKRDWTDAQARIFIEAEIANR